MKNIHKGVFGIAAESNRGQPIIIDKGGRISFNCNGKSYTETTISELTELIEIATKFRDQEAK